MSALKRPPPRARAMISPIATQDEDDEVIAFSTHATSRSISLAILRRCRWHFGSPDLNHNLRAQEFSRTLSYLFSVFIDCV
jgi:hypothetical protein